MDDKSREKGSVEMLNPAYWTIGRWFTLLIVLLAFWCGLYLAAHSDYGMPGYEYTSFSTTQVREINTILTSDNIAINVTPAHNPQTLIDSANTMAPVNEIGTVNTTLGCDLLCRTDKVLIYLNSEYDNKIAPEQIATIRQYISTFGPREVGVFLADYRLKVHSYFWLSGPMIYAELVSWVVFGVLCSLLFAAGNSLRKSNRQAFDSRDVLYQIAKVFYAPFIAVVLLLTYNYFRNNSSLNTGLGQGVIIFAFIAGFYSGRLMNFMDRLKQLILPDSGDHYPTPAAVPAMAMPSYIAETITPVHQSTPEPVSIPTIKEEPAPEPVPGRNAEAYQPAPAPPIPKKDDGLIEAQIEIKLDTAGMYDDEKARLSRQGFAKAIVTLHNVNGKDIIPAKKASEDGSLFIAKGVRPGIYIARATLSQKVMDDHIINLFGERTAYITVDKPGLELYIRKYELVD